MKIILEDEDKKYINRVNADLKTGNDVPLFLPRKGSYSVSFDVTDIAKANNFLLEVVMIQSSERTKEIEEKFGVKFTSVNYFSGDEKLNELKEYIRSFMEGLDNF